MHSILLMLRRSPSLCLNLICISLLVYFYTERQESVSSTATTCNNSKSNRYSYFQANALDTPTSIPEHDILLVIRTSNRGQHIRMPVILDTWFQFSPQSTYITTNGDMTFFYRRLPEQYHHQIYATNCTQAHTIRDLCCHSASEFDIYFQNEQHYKWLCRFDDDQYVNVPLLVDYLKRFSPERELLYIGKPSMKEPKQGHGIQFWFGTYGGGICFSKSLLHKIYSDIQPSERFVNGCVSSRYPDDTHIAYMLRVKYNINLTVASDFHHHIETNLFSNITTPADLDQAITLGFKGDNVPRFIPLKNNDVHRMHTLHCLLYPNRLCMRQLRVLLNQFYEKKQG